MRIATFNVNSIRSRIEPVLAWLKAHRPDVLCLQETKVQDELFPTLELQSSGYHVCYRGEKSYNGVAILARHEPREVVCGFDDGSDPARLLCARIGHLTVVNTYVPQGREVTHPMFEYKLHWYSRLRDWFDRHFTPSSLLVWCGDLNVAKDPIDVFNPEMRANHVCYHQAVRDAFRQCLDWGFVDVFRKHHPEPGQYSFFDYRTTSSLKHNQGWRLDYILASNALAEKSIDCRIDLEPRRALKASDHTVVYADFAL